MKKSLLLFVFIFQIGYLFGQKDFSFVFLPDTHLHPDSAVDANFDHVVKQIKSLQPDFVIVGGDMADNARKLDEKDAKFLFDFVDTQFHKLDIPVHYTIGNHDIVGVYIESGMDPSNPLWGKGMYIKRYGKTYQSFTFSGLKFFILDGIKILEEKGFWTSEVDSLQIEWLKHELLKTDTKMPICIVIHTPLINPLAIFNLQSCISSPNSKAVLDLFVGHNLKLVLQGHNHIYMNLLINGVHYISGGSTSYKPDLKPFDDGFIFVKVKNNIEEIKFIHTAKNTQ